MAFENFPYTNFHEINLDWIIAKVKEAYSSSNPPDYPVTSVNGQTGDVVIAIPSALVRTVNGESGDVILYRNPLVQFPTTEDSRWNLFRICDGDSGDARGIEFDENGAHRIEGVRRILIYDEENQPDFPVTSVNGQTGDVHITAGVNSVNGKTGNVVTPFINPNTDILKLDSNSNTILWGISRDVTGGNVALYITSGGGSPQAFIRYTPTEGDAINLPLLTNADIPESAGVISVNTKTGAVTLYGTDILLSEATAESITAAINNEKFDIKAITDTIYTKSIADSSDWTTGVYRPESGIEGSATRRIRSNNYISADIISTVNNLMFLVMAWDSEDTYIGLYDTSNDEFITPSSYPDDAFIDKFNAAEFKKKYPTYKIKLVAAYFPATNMSPSAAENIQYYTYSGGGGTSPDISQLETTVAEHTQQISALQAEDDTQDQQITALQAADATHNQQISALQAADSTHNQQIAELQSADATHNQQITDLYNASVTQGNQINDLYTRTGIYVVSIPNANTLPLRYPTSGTDNKIKATNKVVSMDLSIPGTQVYNWTITTYDGYLEIVGTINGTSDITLYLA